MARKLKNIAVEPIKAAVKPQPEVKKKISAGNKFNINVKDVMIEVKSFYPGSQHIPMQLRAGVDHYKVLINGIEAVIAGDLLTQLIG